MAKKEEVEALQAENAALRAQQDQTLDLLVEMREELDKLKAGGIAAPPVIGGKSKAEQELDDELAVLKDEFKDFPGIEVLEQRILVGEEVNDDIRLKDEPSILEDPHGKHRKWKVRKFNFGIEGRAARATAEGYIKVRRDELQNTEALPTLSQQDEYARLGERGLEVLCKMPLKLYEHKKKRDMMRRQGLLTSASGLRSHTANRVAEMAAASGMNADQAGSFIAGKTFTMEVTEGEKETVTL